MDILTTCFRPLSFVYGQDAKDKHPTGHNEATNGICKLCFELKGSPQEKNNLFCQISLLFMCPGSAITGECVCDFGQFPSKDNEDIVSPFCIL